MSEEYNVRDRQGGALCWKVEHRIRRVRQEGALLWKVEHRIGRVRQGGALSGTSGSSWNDKHMGRAGSVQLNTPAQPQQAWPLAL